MESSSLGFGINVQLESGLPTYDHTVKKEKGTLYKIEHLLFLSGNQSKLVYPRHMIKPITIALVWLLSALSEIFCSFSTMRQIKEIYFTKTKIISLYNDLFSLKLTFFWII